MNNKEIFSFKGNEIRTIVKDNEPWFVAKDVCGILDIDSSNLSKTLEPYERGSYNIQTLGGNQEMATINESGLYALIFKSRKEEAKKFRLWVTSEVLPAIRLHGGYLTPQKVEEVLADPDTIIRLATDLKKARQELELAKPKLEFANKISSSKGSLSVGAFAKVLGTGRNRLFNWLRARKYIMPGDTIPYQRWVSDGVFEVTEGINNERVWAVSAITPKGQLRIGKEYCKKEEAVA